MARDPHVEARLQRWAQGVTVGDGSGYPVMSVLHPEWQPPSPGVTPTMKVSSASDVRATHRAIAQLSRRLANTLVVHYCLRLGLAEQGERLGCAVQTVHSRIDLAHRLLRGIFAESKSELCNKDSKGYIQATSADPNPV